MKKYRVEFAETAKVDIARSFIWGRKEWGAKAASKWYQSLRVSVRKMLCRFPLSQPLAPESETAGRELRQMIVGRYRIIFEVRSQRVLVLHVRGAFVEGTVVEKDFEGVDE